MYTVYCIKLHRKEGHLLEQKRRKEKEDLEEALRFEFNLQLNQAKHDPTRQPKENSIGCL